MRIHQYSMLCASIMSQEAALEALEHGREPMLAMREQYLRRRNFLTHQFHEMGLSCAVPKGAFYLFPSIAPTGLTSREFALRLLEEEKVAVVPGDAFGPGGEGFVRCSYATGMDQIETAAARIRAFVGRLRVPATV